GAHAAYARHVKASAHAPHIREAAGALDANLPGLAEHILKRHLAGWPNDVAVMAMLGEVLGRTGSNDEALQILERCLVMFPVYGTARQNYATLLFQQQRLPETIAQTDLLLASDPENPRYLSLRA